jgi:hypothetical protein
MKSLFKFLNIYSGNMKFLLIVFISFSGISTIFSQIVIDKQDVSCHGCSDGWAMVTVTGGTPPYDYLWSNGSDASSISGLSAGLYTVLVTDDNGCSGSNSVVIYDHPAPPSPFTIVVLASKDPNDIAGPAGYGEPKWVSVNDELPYLIRFENDPKLATAAVNKVVVTHPIDDMANMFSFRLGNFTFRNFSYDIPPNTTNYFKRLNLVDSIGVYIDVTAGIDVTKKQAFWIFQAFDPVTGLPNLDPSLGFLPINDTATHIGEGSVSFTIKPIIGAKTGDTIHAYAKIVFDVNAPLLTNVALNTIDAKSPVSRIKSITSISSDVIEVSWNGTDDPNGSGIADYKLLISSNNEPYSSYSETTDTSFIVNLAGGNEYKIQSIAKDNTNNMEQISNLPDTILYLRPLVNLGKDMFLCINDSVELNAGSGFDSYLWNNGSKNRTLTTKAAGKYFVTAVKDTIVSSDTIVIGVNQLPNPSLHNNISGFCEGSSLFLNAGSAYKNYSWNSTLENIQTIEVTNPGRYFVTVTDKNGCQAQDSLEVTMYSIPIVNLGNDISLPDNDSLYLIPGQKQFASYLWNNSSIDDSLLVIGKKAGLGKHDYWVEVTDKNSCSNSDTITVNVLSSLNIDFENSEHTGINLYPNPTTGIVNLQITGIESGDLKLELFTMEGSLLLIKEYQDSRDLVKDQLNISQMVAGSYIIKVTYKNTEVSRTIIKL